MKTILIFPLLFLLTTSTYPIALFHGLTGSCTSNKSKEIKRLLEKYLKTKVHCVEIGNGIMDSIFMNLEKHLLFHEIRLLDMLMMSIGIIKKILLTSFCIFMI
jgi:hypothetical protein